MQSLTAPHRCTNLPGNADLVYRSICQTLADLMEQVDTSTLASATLSAGWGSSSLPSENYEAGGPEGRKYD